MIIRHFIHASMEQVPELIKTIETEDVTVLAGYIGMPLTYMDVCPDGDMIDVHSFPNPLHALAWVTTVIALRQEKTEVLTPA